MKAIVIDRSAGGAQSVALRDFEEADLMPGDVLVRVTHSTVNYKDGLAVTGRLQPRPPRRPSRYRP